MRIVGAVLAATLAVGCASLQKEARVRRQAELVVCDALAAPSTELRLQATRIAAEVADARARLLQLAHDRDPGVRGQALYALAALGDRGVLGEVAAALGDAALGVRLAALGALGHLGRDEVGARLLALGGGADRYLALRA